MSEKPRFRLGKRNKLCSVIAIDALFIRNAADTSGALAFPLRAVWRVNPSRKADTDTPKFFISVPKRCLRHAVDRVLMRRRIREAYRLARPEIFAALDKPVDIAFIYIPRTTVHYARVENAMRKLMRKIAESVSEK